ncbi:16S rRNA (guanine(527)-N(7))-methyltransferase RsmG [Hazenella sp. IB182353]|uniref:16S rRNA (guanine(527)-N(7))-methyltransferase RsmG n=1 Tax=Polycladospora coralii TaxID=2771432 RepID=UPI00174750D4|nr:16S rRNA (guanine(527)-N(7))-methyltransferase RsmG [Polycladospora coralii]MBS7530487.1 16S rRNA (guanine(527)-N(7))-methyltransferase RsmG [Polycladospora coralii]
MKHDQWLQEHVSRLGIDLTEHQLEQFQQYYELLIETNKVMNLTGITDRDEVYIKHFYDSLTLIAAFDPKKTKSIIDVGTGAGFPGIPLKIAFPDLEVVLLDSLKKRIHFLQSVVNHLDLSGVTCIHGRAEELAHQKLYRASFDLATARAVAKLNVLAEYCLPFVKVGGMFISMKGTVMSDEVESAKKALHVMGKATFKQTTFELPASMGTRSLLQMQKRDHSPKAYPRRAGLPVKQPLV